MKHQSQKRTQSTSWEPVQKWYQSSVGNEGHYYHQNIVIPGVLRMLSLDTKKEPSALLDLACGQGVLARHIPNHIEYIGVDISPSLIKLAKGADKNSKHQYVISDITKVIPIKKYDFTHAAIILAIQNIEAPKEVFANAAKHLSSNGQLAIVMNHPCFRIPRQSSWKIDEKQKVQFRRIDCYSSKLKIPIQASPSKGEQSTTTWSFHHPLSSYSQWLFEAGFVIEVIEEWHSDKVSLGKAAKMENKARAEFPLFMAIRARKL